MKFHGVEELIKVELIVRNIFEVVEFKCVISLESADDERACARVRGWWTRCQVEHFEDGWASLWWNSRSRNSSKWLPVWFDHLWSGRLARSSASSPRQRTGQTSTLLCDV